MNTLTKTRNGIRRSMLSATLALAAIALAVPPTPAKAAVARPIPGGRANDPPRLG
jgi:hypothetical protein